nr:tetratricopeptide repeat protein [Candidatus Prometheoarchaeum syntrophicum]QEE16214.1 cellulose synthase subunit BcsC [Candidatus Prometheoarchaeum syntrophicum]
MDLHQKLSQLYSCQTKDYHQIAINLLTNLRKSEEFLLVLIKKFLNSPLSMNSQRFLEIANQIPLQVYKNLLNKAERKQKYDVDPLIHHQISGFIQLMLRNYTQADSLFQKSEEIMKNNIHTQFLQSNSARLNFDFTLAEAILNQLLEKDPENAIFWDRRGQIALDRHHFSKAEEFFTKSWEKNCVHQIDRSKKKQNATKHDILANCHNYSLMQLIWIKIEFQQFDQVQELIEIAKKNDLNDPYLSNSLGDLNRFKQDSLGSINAYTNAIEMNPFEPLFWKNLALIYMQIGEFKQTQIALEELMTLDPDKIDPWITYAWFYEEKNEFESAIKKIKEGLEKIPNCAELYIELARCYNEIGEGLGEFKYLQKAREVSPRNVNVLNGLAYYFLNNDDYEASEELFQQILKIDSANITALNGLATLKYEEHHDPISAENYLKQSIEIDPSNLQTWIQYGQLAFHEEKYVEAEKYFKKALNINPHHISVLHYLGLIAWGIHGDLKQTESYFKHALSFADDNISISLDLIELYRTDLKQIDKAKEITKNLLKILPDDKYLKEILKNL